jgi:hypothetical protein
LQAANLMRRHLEDSAVRVEEKGFHQPRDENAVLVTLIVDDVIRWYDYLAERGVELLTDVKEVEEIQVRGFLLDDPSGYTLEIQQSLDPEAAEVFGWQAGGVRGAVLAAG